MVEFRMPTGRDDEPDEKLDQSLRTALRPIPAPPGFADRVLARAALAPKPAPSAVRSRPGFRPALQWAVAAVLLVAISLGAFAFHQRRRRIAGEHARDQVLLALRITGLTIRAVRQQVDRSHNNGSQQETP